MNRSQLFSKQQRTIIIVLLTIFPHTATYAFPCFVKKTLTSAIYMTIKEALVPGKNNGMSYNQCRSFKPDKDSIKACESFAPTFGVNRKFCGSQGNKFFECLCDDLYGR